MWPLRVLKYLANTDARCHGTMISLIMTFQQRNVLLRNSSANKSGSVSPYFRRHAATTTDRALVWLASEVEVWAKWRWGQSEPHEVPMHYMDRIVLTSRNSKAKWQWRRSRTPFEAVITNPLHLLGRVFIVSAEKREPHREHGFLQQPGS